MAVVDSEVRTSTDRGDVNTHAHDPEMRAFQSWTEDIADNLNEISGSNILDYGAIEQIANGLEKMVQSWSIAQEGRAGEYAKVIGSLETSASQDEGGIVPINKLLGKMPDRQDVKDHRPATQGADDPESGTGHGNAQVKHGYSSSEHKSSEEASNSYGDAHKQGQLTAPRREVIQHIDLRKLRDGHAPSKMPSKKKDGHSHMICQPCKQSDVIASADISYVFTQCESTDQGFSPSDGRHTTSSAKNGLDDKEAYKKKVEELQIALLECAAEYEVKLVEMEMKMLQLKSKTPPSEHDHGTLNCGDKKTKLAERQDWTKRKLEISRKQNGRLQRENEALVKELQELKRKERQFDSQRKSLEDALLKVNSLQKELVKKEEELVDCQLSEKAVRAQLYQVGAALQTSNSTFTEETKFLSLINAVGQWLQTVRKISSIKFDHRQLSQLQQYEEDLAKIREEFSSRIVHQRLSNLKPLDALAEKQLNTSPTAQSEIRKDVQALQNELEKLASRKLS